MRRVKKVKKTKVSRAPIGHNQNRRSINKMLYEDGYTTDEIDALRKERRIAVCVHPSTLWLDDPDELYVIDPKEEKQEEEVRLDRGYLVELE